MLLVYKGESRIITLVAKDYTTAIPYYKYIPTVFENKTHSKDIKQIYTTKHTQTRKIEFKSYTIAWRKYYCSLQ